MTPDLKQRLLAFADEEIARQSEQSNYLGGNRVVVQDRLVSLPTLAAPVQEERRETWILLIYAEMYTYDDGVQTGFSPLQLVSFVPRQLGLPFNADAIFWEATELRISPSPPPSEKTLSIRFLCRTVPSQADIPVIPNTLPVEETTPYGGSVSFTMREVDTVSVIDTRTVVIPEDGTNFIHFSGSPLVPPMTLTTLRPWSAARVR